MTRLSKILIIWLPALVDKVQFHIAHLDLDLQNVIVPDKGERLGIIH